MSRKAFAMSAIALGAAQDLDDHESVGVGSLTVAGLSTIIEWYDFTLYLYFAAVLSRVFYGGGAGGMGTLLLGFAISYLLRPVGAAFFGHLGDRTGRRRVLLISMGLMTGAMLAMALLPTYAMIGATAGWLMLFLRCVMSFSVGGEYSGVITYLVEGAPSERRGFITSLASASSEIGGLLAVGVSAITTALVAGPALDSWGWRIPFFIGAALAGTTLLARSQMHESPVFEAAEESDGNPLVTVLRTQWRGVLRTFAISGLGSITYYVGITYAPTFLTSVGKFTEADALGLSTVAAVAVIVVTPIAGWLSDRWGRRPVLLFFVVAALLSSFTMFALMARGSGGFALLGAVVLACVAGGVSAVAASAIPEQFASSSRLSGMALGFTAATALFGGLAPWVANQLIESTGWQPVPGAMIAVVALAVVPVVWFLPETSPQTARRGR